LENNLKNKKALQQMSKCLLLSGSPDCSIDRTFTSIFHFPKKVTKANQIKHAYRNPIYLAREYKRMIYNDQVKNQSDLARKLGISRVRICQILNLLKLNPLIIQALEKLYDPLKSKIITERMLRSNVNKSFKDQIKILDILYTLFHNIHLNNKAP